MTKHRCKLGGGSFLPGLLEVRFVLFPSCQRSKSFVVDSVASELLIHHDSGGRMETAPSLEDMKNGTSQGRLKGNLYVRQEDICGWFRVFLRFL